MADLFSDLYQWIFSLSPLWTYVILFAIAYGENIVPPIPGDVAIAFGGYLAGVTEINAIVVWALATLGGGLGFMTVYAFGRSLGGVLFETEKFPWIPRDKMREAQSWVQKWGFWVVITNRFLSGTRSVISLVVGMGKMAAWPTAGAASFSALVWTGLIIYAGYLLGENWERVAEYLQVYSGAVLVLIAAGGAALLVRWIYRRKKKNRRISGGGREK